MITVDRCLCRGVTFAEAHRRAVAGGWSLETLMQETGCGLQCGLCLPYLTDMLRTGRTVFHSLLPAGDG